jgi:transposase
LSKFQYSQPTHRHLQDLKSRSLPVSPGTVAGGLQTITPLFKPIMEGLYQKQMTEALFHNDETRWEVFVEMEGKVGHRWYLWVTRSKSVIYFVLDPSRSADIPGAHFAGLQGERVIIVCDRYSAYKKLARLTDAILLAFCWAHVRRDHLDAGRSHKALEPWALDWKERIGELYHRNHLRLEHWDSERPLDQQSFRVLLTPLTCIHAGKARPLTGTIKPCRKPCRGCTKKPPASARTMKKRWTRPPSRCRAALASNNARSARVCSRIGLV